VTCYPGHHVDGRWYIIITKVYEQFRMGAQARPGQVLLERADSASGAEN
jgi:hypothetical protein